MLHAFEAGSAPINQYSTRWSDLELYMPQEYYQYFHATDNHAPILKFIRLHCPVYTMSWNLHSFQLTCPRLERANFSITRVKRTDIQLDNFTHLTKNCISIIDSFLILSKTPRLVFCRVSGLCSSQHRDHWRIRTPVLTSLKSLQLLVTRFADNFLNNLTAPHLEELSLPKHYFLSWKVIISFLRRSACSLRSFFAIFDDFIPYYF